MWHHFGYEPSERAHDLVTMYKTYFEKDINSSNLGRLVEQYIARTDINLTRGGETLQVGDCSTIEHLHFCCIITHHFISVVPGSRPEPGRWPLSIC